MRYPLILGQIQLIRTILGRKIGQIWRSGQFWENFGEARYNLDKSAEPLSGQKLPFRDQASPTIPRGPSVTVAVRDDDVFADLVDFPI